MTPDDLRVKMSRKAIRQRQDMRTADRILSGSVVPAIPPEVARLFNVQPVTVPICQMLIDSQMERLRPTGFRSSPDDVADDDLAALARAANFWPMAALAMQDAQRYGHGMLMIWADSAGMPLITAASPMTTTFLRDPLTGAITAGQTEWRDDDSGTVHTATYTGDSIYRWESKSTPIEALVSFDVPLGQGGDAELVDEQPNPLGVVPLVPFINRPSTTHPDGVSDVADVEDLVRALCKTITDSQVANEALAMPATVLLTEAHTNVEQAKEIREVLLSSLSAPGGARATIIGGGAKLSQLDAADLVNFKTEAELLVDMLAASLGIPNYWVRGNVANPVSGESIRSAEHRLTMRVRERTRWFAPSLVEAIRMAQRVRDGYWDPRLSELDIIWGEEEASTLAQEADAITKLYASGVIDQRAALAALNVEPLEAERILANSTGLPLPDSVQSISRDADGNLVAVRNYSARRNIESS